MLRNINQVIGKGYFLTMTFSGKYFKLSCGIRIRMYDFCKLANFSHEDVYYWSTSIIKLKTLGSAEWKTVSLQLESD